MYPRMVIVSSAVAMQLNSLGVQPGETSLREQLVEYLQSSTYMIAPLTEIMWSAPVVSQ